MKKKRKEHSYFSFLDENSFPHIQYGPEHKAELNIALLIFDVVSVLS